MAYQIPPAPQFGPSQTPSQIAPPPPPGIRLCAPDPVQTPALTPSRNGTISQLEIGEFRLECSEAQPNPRVQRLADTMALQFAPCALKEAAARLAQRCGSASSSRIQHRRQEAEDARFFKHVTACRCGCFCLREGQGGAEEVWRGQVKVLGDGTGCATGHCGWGMGKRAAGICFIVGLRGRRQGIGRADASALCGKGIRVWDSVTPAGVSLHVALRVGFISAAAKSA